MLPKPKRLSSPFDFRRVKKFGRRKEGRLSLWFSLQNKKKETRFGIVVSNRISKKATQRNKLKRYFRETIRFFLASFPPSMDNIFFVKKEALGAPLEDIKNDFRKILG